MPKDEYISITDAAELAGVSKKTIERAYKKFMEHPEFGRMIERREHGSGYRYFVTNTFIDKCVANKSTQKRVRDKHSTASTDSRSVAALVEQLEIKDRRIDKLTEILQQKDEFTQALIRKGLNLPEGTAQLTKEDSSEDAVEGLTAKGESTPIVDARVVDAETGSPNNANRPLFPTVKRGLAVAGEYLGKTIF